MKKLFCATLTFAFVLLAVGTCLAADVTPQTRDRSLATARRYLSEGKIDKALAELDALYRKASDDATVVRVYADVLIETHNYSKAEKILSSFLKNHPNENALKAKLALVSFLKGNTKRGMEILEKIISTAPDEEWTYTLAMNVLAEIGDREGVIDIITRARKATGDSTLFGPEAIRLYIDAGRVGDAVHEYLLRFASENRGGEKGVPQRFAQKILDLASDDEARAEVISALVAEKSRKEFADVVSRVLWQLYLLDGNCKAALEEIQAGAGNERELARSLPLFAREATRRGCFEECAKAYELVAKLKQSGLNLADVLLKKAQCEYLGNDVEDALKTYQDLVDRFVGTKWAWDAVLARADIYYNSDNFQNAVKEADKVISNTRSPELLARAVNIKGDCLVKLGDLEKAFETYDLVEIEWQGALAQEAFYNLGEISLYEGKFDEAVSYYNVALRQYPQEDLANDCIERLMLIRASKAGEKYPQELGQLAQAYLLERRGRIEEAKDRYLSLSKIQLKPIKVESLRRLAEIYRRAGNPNLAIAIYRVIADSLASHIAPAALEAIADIYVELDEIEKAKETYEDLILRFPESVAAGEARRKIDGLRSSQSSDS